MEEIPWEELDDELKNFWVTKEAYLAVGPSFRQRLKESPKKEPKEDQDYK